MTNINTLYAFYHSYAIPTTHHFTRFYIPWVNCLLFQAYGHPKPQVILSKLKSEIGNLKNEINYIVVAYQLK